MLDGVDPAMVGEIRHSAEHVKGIKKVLDIKARWLGHRLYADVAVLVDEALSVSEADQIADTLKHEMIAHIPALSVVNVRCQGSENEDGVTAASGGHHHAPDPFKVESAIANGVLLIVDTPKGERMRLTLYRAVEGLEATVTIYREDGKVETLTLLPTSDNFIAFESAVAPQEPHEFSAQLRLKSADRSDVLPFKMTEPVGHHH
jgi:hypothetical protein